jgi:hypothetical protein
MEREYFDSTPEVEELYGGSENDPTTFIRVNGANLPVEAGSNFKETVKSHAIEAGLGKFRCFLNGREIKPKDAPESIDEGSQLELRPYDAAGC